MRGKNYKPDIITLEQKINSTITAEDTSEDEAIEVSKEILKQEVL